ncbi:DUF6033 family protein [Paenibacillus riograndensis]|uniref:Uncharacterized protein n=1 Tax=Paenibacillus riograndensis SBR5 TaxID=1073571 RepID=A0A0E4HF08_9BACL|nr:DUF6033 family protein [Paenibacillus riograndensis]CQR58097.1 hypothetical protein PRIO_5710 [Paenibacillus riograndensis SBR5]
MNISSSAIHSGALVNSTAQNNRITSTSSGSANFNLMLSKAATADTAALIAQQYGLSVGVESIPKNEQEIVSRGSRGNLQDVVIAPDIVEQMKTDSKLAEKIKGYIDHYANVDLPAFAQMDAMYGVTNVGSSLIIHEDGTKTVWSASVTSPEEVEKGRKIEAEKQKEKAEERERLEALHVPNQTMTAALGNLPYSKHTPPGNTGDLALYQGISSQEWLHQRSLFISKKRNELV